MRTVPLLIAASVMLGWSEKSISASDFSASFSNRTLSAFDGFRAVI
jgi:hypothetical protein